MRPACSRLRSINNFMCQRVAAAVKVAAAVDVSLLAVAESAVTVAVVIIAAGSAIPVDVAPAAVSCRNCRY